MVALLDDRWNMRFDIPDSELRWRFDTSGGPGGQHANKSNTRAELIFDIEHSLAFDERIRRCLVDELGTEIRITEDGSRSQSTNRKRALRRLHGRLEDATRQRPAQRRVTKPSRSARARRLDRKRARGVTKQQRKSPELDD